MPRVKFSVNYQTQFGEQLYIVGNFKQFIKGVRNDKLLMNFENDQTWSIELELKATKTKKLRYHYLLVQEANELEVPELKTHEFDVSKIKTSLHRMDAWSNPRTLDYLFDSQAFKVLLQKKKPKKSGKIKGNVHFEIDVALVPSRCKVGVIGSINELGAWQEEKVVLMNLESNMRWSTKIKLNEKATFEYKYVVVDTEQNIIAEWESGVNRRITFNQAFEELVVNDEPFRRSLEGRWRGAGVAVPVFSLRSSQSLGVGEFSDLKLLVDWANEAGMTMIQLLPINDTTAYGDWRDSYPYAAVSIFALHPQYLSLSSLPYRLKKELRDKIQKATNKLSKPGNKVDYESVMKTKNQLVRDVFKSKKNSFLKSKEFKSFFSKNKKWLVPYAAFCVLRDQKGTSDFSQWGKQSKFSRRAIKALVGEGSESYDEIALVYFVQYHLHLQLMEAVRYAHQKGIVLKGDIPIGIYRHSCDAWVEPKLFEMKMQAGAPPDDFSIDGQNWGFPTYQWEVMAQDGYAWWKNRFGAMSQYFDAFRIDHILGFFRIWQIPIEQTSGLMGYFSPGLGFSQEEIRAWGIPFEYKRFCQPYISSLSLEHAFGEELDQVENFFERGDGDHFTIKAEYASLRELKGLMERGELSKKYYQGLKELITNVLFVEEETTEGISFHPRQMIHLSKSFQELPIDIQTRLMELYNHYYYQRHEAYWKTIGMQKLPALRRATDMLICGEDLGMVPACVPEVMDDLSILSLRVQRMPHEPGARFSIPGEAPYLSVVTASSHDTSPLRAWWEENADDRQYYFNQVLHRGGEAPIHCETDILAQILEEHFQSPAMWCIQPIQEFMGLDEESRWPIPEEERINIPANIPHYWRWRMHLTLEELIANQALTERIRRMIESSGRVIA